MDERDDFGAGDYRRWLQDAHQRASQDFDKAVMTLSSGALGLSIAFTKQIAPAPVKSVCWLAAAWTLLAGSLLSILFSFIFSQRAIKDMIRKIDEAATEHWEGRSARITEILNVAAAITLVAGVVCLVRFALLNMT